MSFPNSNRQSSMRRIFGYGAAGVLILALGGFAVWSTWPGIEDDDQADFLSRFRGGSLVIAGGGELPPIIRQRFLDLAGGPDSARIVVIPAFDFQDSEQDRLLRPWKSINVRTVRILHTTSRQQADDASFAESLDNATGVWLSGGNQAWLSKHYVGTLVESKLKEVIDRGGVIGGSSAGAAAMTKVMIEQGQEEAVEGVGFDLLPDAVVDQHFLKRSRLNRLMGLMDSHPGRIAFGIDEGTALVVQADRGTLGVVGKSYVIAYVPQTDSGVRRFEVLKNSDQIDIQGLRNGKVRVSSTADLDAILNDTSP
ncbi:MAG: cyanophycinase [Planctomycetaceae bacterium]